jgi:2-desacetyl-2-hydroxyethyl bacteriochlorophyllide A dehydrogenase
MKALQFQGVGRLDLVDVPVPRPGPMELLVRTGVAVICTSDVNELRTGIFGAELPVIFGHEGAGTVAAVGSDVKGFSVSDRVATHPVHSCRRCPNCEAGMAHLCQRMRHFGLNMPGTFAEFYVVGAERARRVAPATTFTAAALAEPVSVCLQALKQASVGESSKLLILGDGPFGILISILAKAMGVKHVVMTGRHDFRLSRSSADEKINLRKDQKIPGAERSAAGLAGAFAGGPFDAAILAVGSATAAQQGLALIRPKGRLVIFSAVNDPVPIDLLSVHIRELQIVGACNDEDLLDEAVRRIDESPEHFARLVTHSYAPEQYSDAFARAAEGHDDALKVAFNFENEKTSA